MMTDLLGRKATTRTGGTTGYIRAVVYDIDTVHKWTFLLEDEKGELHSFNCRQIILVR